MKPKLTLILHCVLSLFLMAYWELIIHPLSWKGMSTMSCAYWKCANCNRAHLSTNTLLAPCSQLLYFYGWKQVISRWANQVFFSNPRYHSSKNTENNRSATQGFVAKLWAFMKQRDKVPPYLSIKLCCSDAHEFPRLPLISKSRESQLIDDSDEDARE